MKILHTSDWHVGKVLKGVHRIDEQRRVLSEIVEIARVEDVDLALVAGDLFESSAPSPEAQGLVWDTASRPARRGRGSRRDLWESRLWGLVRSSESACRRRRCPPHGSAQAA